MLVWGSSFTVTKIAVKELPPFTFALLRFLVASLILAPIFLAKRKHLVSKDVKLPYVYILLLGLTGITLYYLFFNVSLKYTTASQGALIQGIIPFAIAVIAAIMLKEKNTATQKIGIALSVLGVLLVGFVSSDNDTARNAITGNLLMVAATVSWAFYTVISKKITHINSLVVTSLATFIGTVLFIPVAWIEVKNTSFSYAQVSAGAWFSIIYLGAMASALSYFLYNRALETMTASQVGAFINLDPIIGAIIAFIFLDEQITWLQIIGAILVLLGIYFSSKAERDSKH